MRNIFMLVAVLVVIGGVNYRQAFYRSNVKEIGVVRDFELEYNPDRMSVTHDGRFGRGLQSGCMYCVR